MTFKKMTDFINSLSKDEASLYRYHQGTQDVLGRSVLRFQRLGDRRAWGIC